MKRILFLILVSLIFTNVEGQNFIQTTSDNPGTNSITHRGVLNLNELNLKSFFNMYSLESGYTNRRLTLNTNDGKQAFVYYYDATAKTFHTLNIGGSNSLYNGLTILGNGNVGIGTPTPNVKLEIKSNEYSISEGLRLVDQGGGAAEGLWVQFAQADMVNMARIGAKSYNTTSGGLYFSTKNNSDAGSVERMRIDQNGNVGIGTTSPNYKLDIEGTIRATEIKVEAKTADFVFEPDYKLRPLNEVEAFVKTNKHLPEIPSAKQMEAEGVNVAEMNKLLLQKVEELTLYLIEMKKDVTKLKKENTYLKKKIETL